LNNRFSILVLLFAFLFVSSFPSAKELYIPVKKFCKYRKERRVGFLIATSKNLPDIYRFYENTVISIIKATFSSYRFVYDEYKLKDYCVYNFPKYNENEKEWMNRLTNLQNDTQKKDNQMPFVKISFLKVLENTPSNDDVWKIALLYDVDYVVFGFLGYDKNLFFLVKVYSRILGKIVFTERIVLSGDIKKDYDIVRTLSFRTFASLFSVYGKLEVISEPSGAYVLVNGRLIGKTPLVFYPIIFGKVDVKVVKKGYKAYRNTFFVTKKDSTKKINVLLRKKIKKSLDIMTGSLDYIFTDGYMVGKGEKQIFFDESDLPLYLEARRDKLFGFYLFRGKGKKVVLSAKPLYNYKNERVYHSLVDRYYYGSMISGFVGVFGFLWYGYNKYTSYEDTRRYGLFLGFFSATMNLYFAYRLGGVVPYKNYEPDKYLMKRYYSLVKMFFWFSFFSGVMAIYFDGKVEEAKLRKDYLEYNEEELESSNNDVEKYRYLRKQSIYIGIFSFVMGAYYFYKYMQVSFRSFDGSGILVGYNTNAGWYIGYRKSFSL
jgi:hypothetical protein